MVLFRAPTKLSLVKCLAGPEINEIDFSGIISGKSVRATEFHASVLENINKSSI